MSRLLFSAVLLSGLVGCGGGGTEVVLVPVTGSVTLKGEKVPNAMVQFDPSKGPSSTATSDVEGKFILMAADRKGAIAGPHKVTVTVGLPSTSGADSMTEQPVESKPPVNYVFETPVQVESAGSEIELKLDTARKSQG